MSDPLGELSQSTIVDAVGWMLGHPSIWVGDCWSRRSRPTVAVGEGRLRQAPSPRGSGKPPEGRRLGALRGPRAASLILLGSVVHADAWTRGRVDGGPAVPYPPLRGGRFCHGCPERRVRTPTPPGRLGSPRRRRPPSWSARRTTPRTSSYPAGRCRRTPSASSLGSRGSNRVAQASRVRIPRITGTPRWRPVGTILGMVPTPSPRGMAAILGHPPPVRACREPAASGRLARGGAMRPSAADRSPHVATPLGHSGGVVAMSPHWVIAGAAAPLWGGRGGRLHRLMRGPFKTWDRVEPAPVP